MYAAFIYKYEAIKAYQRTFIKTELSIFVVGSIFIRINESLGETDDPILTQTATGD